jgi:hypothetical protein
MHQDAELAATTEEWLLSLRGRIEEVEGDSPEAFSKRRELVRLLVERIVVGRDEEGNIRVETTYRFGPPSVEEPEDVVSGEYDSSRSSAQKG